jgi:hypothetical protein
MARDELMQAIRSVIAGDALCLSDIARSVGRGPKDGSVRNALAALVAAGELERVGGEYRRVQAVVAPPCTDAAPCTGELSSDGLRGDDDDELPWGVPEPPVGLGVAGRDVWIDAWTVSWTQAPDAAGIAHLARLEDEAARLVATIDEQGVVSKRPIVSPKGNVVGDEWVSHPLIGDLRKLDAQLMRIRASLGLDPASRARLALNGFEKRPDAIDELQQRRRERLAAMARAEGLAK